jgi:hypothetical protein
MDYEKAAAFWEAKDAHAVRMEKGALFAEMEKFILAHNTCALASACGDFVRCTPIEYNYYEEKFWLFSEGGQKFRALKGNKNVCLAIFDAYTGFGKLGGMQISGTAAIIAPGTAAYGALAAYKKIPLEKLPHALYLICVTPARIEFLWSGFKKLGVDVRQHLDFGK